MHNLILIIGPAPSELIEEEFTEKLRTERLRVTIAIDEYRPKKKKTKTPKTKKVGVRKRRQEDAELLSELTAAGMTKDDLIQMMKERKEKKEE